MYKAPPPPPRPKKKKKKGRKRRRKKKKLKNIELAWLTHRYKYLLPQCSLRCICTPCPDPHCCPVQHSGHYSHRPLLHKFRHLSRRIILVNTYFGMPSVMYVAATFICAYTCAYRVSQAARLRLGTNYPTSSTFRPPPLRTGDEVDLFFLAIYIVPSFAVVVILLAVVKRNEQADYTAFNR